MITVRAAVILAGLLCAAVPTVRAEAVAPPPSSHVAAGGAPAWKQIYEDGQTIYFVAAASVQQTGESDIESLLEFKVPQVVDGVQVASVVSRMKLSCDQRRMVTIDNTLYAQPMGAGRIVQAQASNDTWHAPEPGSLGDLIWGVACGRK
jgi:hypothetical protein